MRIVAITSEHVEENRKRLFAAGNLPSKPVWLEQVHGKAVLKLTGEPYASKRADASYSNTPGTVCAVMTADCLPVLFCNQAGTEVAAAHAGWRGLCEGVLEETVACFRGRFCKSHRPGLARRLARRHLRSGPKCAMPLWKKDPQAVEAFVASGDKYLADIYQLARQRLNNVGVTQIFGGDRCTFTEKGDFFSYRRDKTTGRMASFIWLI